MCSVSNRGGRRRAPLWRFRDLGSCGLTLLALLALAGCRTPGYEERTKDASRFRASLQEETQAFFATNSGPLTLAFSMELARARTLKLTQAQLDLQVAKIQRATAFSAFLPQVEATYTRKGTDVPLMRAFGPQSVQMSSRYVSEASIALTQPIFTPGAWLLFVESRHAVRARELVRTRAGELLDVQVASLFYQAAVSEQMAKTYERQREATQALCDQINALAREGYALAAEQARAKARLMSDAYNVRQANDALTITRAQLFEILHFWPLEHVRLEGESMTAVLARDWALTAEDGTAQRVTREQVKAMQVEDLLWQTLVNRKELWAGDQMIAVRKLEVMRALTGFLPNLYGAVSVNHTSEVLQTPGQYWGGGLSAVLSLFNGFRTVEDYREAKARRKAEFQIQEDRASALLVAAFEAYQNWQLVFEQREVATQFKTAAELDYSATHARYRENKENLSDVLDRLAIMEAARVHAVMAEYACALAEIVLRDAVGVGLQADRVMEKQAAEAFQNERVFGGMRSDFK